MKVAAFIPARGGSKGIPNKNIKILNEKPLIGYTLDVAFQGDVDELVVSSDSEEIHEIVDQYADDFHPNAKSKLVHHHRPADISGDKNLIHEAIRHYSESAAFSGDDVLIVMQPTSPLRRVKDLNVAIEIMRNQSINNIVSVCEVKEHPEIMLHRNKEGFEFLLGDPFGRQRQQYQDNYYINGSLYLVRFAHFMATMRLYHNTSKLLLMNKLCSVDIDTMDDFHMAEALLKYFDRDELQIARLIE